MFYDHKQPLRSNLYEFGYNLRTTTKGLREAVEYDTGRVAFSGTDEEVVGWLANCRNTPQCDNRGGRSLCRCPFYAAANLM